MEQRLDGSRAQSGRERRRDEPVQQLEARDLPVVLAHVAHGQKANPARTYTRVPSTLRAAATLTVRSEEHTSELQSRLHLVCRLLLEKKKKNYQTKRHNVETTRRET